MRPLGATRSPATTAPAAPARRPFRDNPRLILAGIAILVALLAGILALADRTTRLSPDFQTEVVLYALSATNLMMLLGLGFMLARNIVKLLVERRRAIPFVRFRAKLVFVLLGMTLIPAVLVLIVGSQVVLTAIGNWFNTPVEEVLSSANQIAADYYAERQRSVSDESSRLAGALAPINLTTSDVGPIRDLVAPDVNQQRIGMVQVYRVVRGSGGQLEALPIVDVAAPSMPQAWSRASADRLATLVASGTATEPFIHEPVNGGGELLRAASTIRSTDGRVTGVVVASEYLSGDLADRSRRMTREYEKYTQMRVLKQPLAGVYLSFFVMVTLLILVSATWMGFYLAKRITRPVQMLSTAAREIGQGHYDQRLEHEAADEFGSMIEAFNSMAAELASNRRRLERVTIDLERKHQEVEGRRRYIETILERVATGVVSIDPMGQIGTVNSAAMKLLNVDAGVLGGSAVDLFSRPDLRPINEVLDQAARAKADVLAKEVIIVREGRELHVVVAATRLTGAGGTYEGIVVVLDDMTTHARAQKVAAWQEVARRLAHEIKNPLTPIQLSAERMSRKLTDLDAPRRDFVHECTTTIVAEVEALKRLVDQFSDYAKMAAPNPVPTDLHRLLTDALALNRGVFPNVHFDLRLDENAPQVHVDPDQIRRVIMNLVDNAIEAMNQAGHIVLETSYDASMNIVRIVVADDGPGVPEAERERLFLPYFSTKGRGSGWGLAIVRRIIDEHGGSVDVTDNVPRGTRFTIELPS